MKPLSRQIIIWLIVIIGTASLYGAVYHWVKVKIDLPPPDKRALVLIDLNQLTPTPNVVSAVEKEIPPPEPEMEKEQDLPPLPEPPPKTLPKKELEPEPQPRPEASIQQKKLEDEAQRLAELRRKREKAQQAIEAKRRRQAEQLRIEANQKKAEAHRAKLKAQIASKPSAIHCPKPQYPKSSQRSGHEGTVILIFTVDREGAVSSVRVSKTSGHPALDQAALKTINQWKFKPARNGLNQPTSYEYILPIPFRLK